MGPNDRRHPVFTAPELEARFRRFGFVRVPFLDAAALGRLVEQVAQLGLHGEAGFVDTNKTGLTPDQREELHRTLSSAMSPVAETLLDRYQPVTSSLLTKWPGSDSSKEIHRDPRMVDEDQYRVVCVWVPFVDVDEHNGALAVLPGSHEVDPRPRTIPRPLSTPLDPVASLRFDDLEPVPASAGDAVIFDLALAHGSAPNVGVGPRAAAALAYAPRAAQLSISVCSPDDRVERFDVPEPEEFRRLDWSQGPTGLRSLGGETSSPAAMTGSEFRELSGRAAADPDSRADRA